MQTITWNTNTHMSAHTESGYNIILDGSLILREENLGVYPITKMLIIASENISHAKVKKAITFCSEKYYSALVMLIALASITHSFEVVSC